MILHYRKNSGDETLNCFQTEYGTVGVLLGAEVEDESRWSFLLSQCVLILNPCNAPMELDQALAKAHPELLDFEDLGRHERISVSFSIHLFDVVCPL